MALPLVGAMIGAQVLGSVVGGVFGLINQHKQSEQQDKMMAMMKEQQSWQRGQFERSFGPQMPQGQGYPQMA